MYYLGTKTKCDAYNVEVTNGENYSGTTLKWAETIKHTSKEEYAIIAHDDYPSLMNTIEELPSDWYSIT